MSRLTTLVQQANEGIACWYEAWSGQVYLAFSGGMDSTLLGYLIRQKFPDVPFVFINTGLEYPEIVPFVKTFDNVIILRPKKSFKWVVENKGYPLGSKKIAKMIRSLRRLETDKNIGSHNLYRTGVTKGGRISHTWKLSERWVKYVDSPFKISEECCGILKKEPNQRYVKKTNRLPYLGMMNADGGHRDKITSCNMYDAKEPKSYPLKNWTKQDVLCFIKTNNIPYCSVYGEIIKVKGLYYTTKEERTGCMFCMFGITMEKGEFNRFQRMQITHPKQYKYCMEKLGIKEVLKFGNIPYKTRKGLFK